MSEFQERIKADMERIRVASIKEADVALKKTRAAEIAIQKTEKAYKAKCEAVLDLISDYQKTEKKLQAETEKELLGSRVTMEDYKAGRCSADDFRARGITREELLRKIEAEGEIQLGAALTGIREESMAVVKMQLDLELQKKNLIYLMGIPPQMEIAYMRAKITELESENNSIAHDSPGITSRVKALKHRIAQAEAGTVTEGRAWYHVSPSMIENTIRFDPLVPRHLLTELMQIRAEMISAGIEVMASPLTLTPHRSTAAPTVSGQAVRMGEERAGWSYNLGITQSGSIQTGDLHE